MANWFEDITKTLADEKLSRRKVVMTMAGITVGAAIGAIIQEDEAFAANHYRGGHYCKIMGCCSCGGYPNCQLKKWGNTNCYCFQKLGSNSGVCACNTYCSSVTPCIDQARCPTGYACITNDGCGCASGVCVQKCTKTCTLDVNGSGRTAA